MTIIIQVNKDKYVMDLDVFARICSAASFTLIRLTDPTTIDRKAYVEATRLSSDLYNIQKEEV